MTYAFFGTPYFASLMLQKLIDAGMPPVIVVCNPDRLKGKKKILASPEVKILAQKHSIPVWQPERMNAREAQQKFSSCNFAVVATYAHVIKREIIDIFPKGIIGIHFSKLPKYRGPSPIQGALLGGETTIATTFSQMDEQLDHGPILLQKETPIKENENREKLDNRLAELSGDLLVDFLPRFHAGAIKPIEQNHKEATYTQKYFGPDGRVDLEKDNPKSIWLKIRALGSEPGVFTEISGKRIKLLEARFENENLRITKIQIAGKKPRDINEREQKEILGI